MSGLGEAGIASIVEGMQEYHKKHVAYDQAYGVVDALSRMRVDESGSLVKLKPGDKETGLRPAVDPELVQSLKANTASERARNQGSLEALARLGIGTAQKVISQRIEDASLSGQRTNQIIQQSERTFAQDQEKFPLEQENLKARTAHLKKITEDEGKVNVPGFGLMTPAQYSSHLSRQERMDVLKKKSDPILNFENQLKNAYGLGIDDIVQAANPQKFTVDEGGRFTGKKLKETTGTPYFDINGTQVSAEQAAQKPQDTFVLAGPNKIPIPLIDTEHGLGWKQIIGKAKGFSSQVKVLGEEQDKLDLENKKLQAEKIISSNKGKGKDRITPEDQVAIDWANGILGQ